MAGTKASGLALALGATHMRRESMMSFFMMGLLALVVLPQPLKLSSCTYWLVSVM